jgi:hypothetical protein
VVVNPETPSNKISFLVRFPKSLVLLNTKILSHIKKNTNEVRIAKPVSDATFFKPAFAITEVKPAKTIDISAKS